MSKMGNLHRVFGQGGGGGPVSRERRRSAAESGGMSTRPSGRAAKGSMLDGGVSRVLDVEGVPDRGEDSAGVAVPMRTFDGSARCCTLGGSARHCRDVEGVGDPWEGTLDSDACRCTLKASARSVNDIEGVKYCWGNTLDSGACRGDNAPE